MSSPESIKLRAFEPEDVMAVLECENRREDWWTGEMTAPYSFRQLDEYARNYKANPFEEGQLRLIAEDEAGNFIGIADFYEISARHRRCFIGICIKPEYRSKGFGKLLLREMLRYNEEVLGLETIAARIAVGNIQSERLFNSAGFRQIAILPGWHCSGTARWDIGIHIYQFSLGSTGSSSQGR